MIKQEFINCLLETLSTSLKEMESHQEDLSASLSKESRSTAGDKHDTSRAMIHLEQEKIQFQIGNIRKQYAQLEQFLHCSNSTKAQMGSLIELENSTYFLLGIGLGKMKTPSGELLCTAADTPVGKQLLGKKAGNEIFFAGKKCKILRVN